MYVDVHAKMFCKLDIESDEAFRILCRTLMMECFCNGDIEKLGLSVRKDSDGTNVVYYVEDGHDEVYDDRGDLFVALANVAVNIYPNVEFRNEDYIYRYRGGTNDHGRCGG